MIQQVSLAALNLPQSDWQENLLCLGVYEPELTGHACVSRMFGGVWLHSLEYWGEDKYQVAKLFLKVRKWLKDNNITEVYTDATNPDLVDFYRRHGFTLERILMKGHIS